MMKILVLSLITIGVAFLLVPGYVELMFELVIELRDQWFWFVK